MNPSEVDYISGLVRQRSGLVLSPDKGYLLESRLAPVARREGFESISDLIAALQTRRDERLAMAITEAMTTNETYFFRDKTPFEHVADHMLPHLVETRPPEAGLRIWCAGCSSGQEAYSLAMIVDGFAAKLGGRKVEILGGDICSAALEKAKAGAYSQFEVQRGLPVTYLVNHFEQQGEMWRVAPELKRFVTFRHMNLLDNPSKLGEFDIVFCRNVLTYFDAETKRGVLERLSKQIADDGFLVLGAAETIASSSQDFVHVKGCRGVFARPTHAKANVA